jgi:hypothetical protein
MRVAHKDSISSFNRQKEMKKEDAYVPWDLNQLESQHISPFLYSPDNYALH